MLRTRVRPWLRRTLAGLAGIVAFLALAVVVVLVVLHSLDQPWLKRRIQALAHDSAGIDVDYRVLRVDVFSGVHLEDLVVRSPAEVRSIATNLVRVGRIDAYASLGTLLFGHGALVDQLIVSNIDLTVVVDEHGRSSFDALSRPNAPASPPPATPLSGKAAQFLGRQPPIGQVEIDHVTFNLVRTANGAVFDRTQLRGLALTLATSTEPTKGWRVDAGLGSRSRPLDLALSRALVGAEARSAHAQLWLTLTATSATVRAAIDLRILDQTFVAHVPAAHGLHAEANVRFHPAAGQTEITLEHTGADDDAAVVDAALTMSDSGNATVSRARGDIDLARLLHWLPEGLLPVSAKRARLRFEVDSLVLGSTIQLSKDSTLSVEADLSKVSVTEPMSPLEVAAAKLSLHARRAQGGGIAGAGQLTVSGARVSTPAAQIAVRDVTCDFDGTQAIEGPIDGRAAISFKSLELTGSSPTLAREGRLELVAKTLHVDTAEPRATRGDVSLSLKVSALETRLPTVHSVVHDLALQTHAALTGHAPYAAELEARAVQLHVSDHADHTLADAPFHLRLHAADVEPDREHPIGSRGKVGALIELGDVQVAFDATKQANTMDFTIDSSAKTLEAARAFLPPTWLDAAAWDAMAMRLRSQGHVDHLDGSEPALRQTSQLDVENVAYQNIAVRSIVLNLQSQGTALRHKADVELHLKALAVDGGAPNDDHITIAATVDRTRPAVELHVASEGRATTQLTAALTFDAARCALGYDIEGKLARLAALTPLLAKLHGLDAFDLSQLEVGLSARGTLLGVITSVARDGTITFAPKPEQTFLALGTADLKVAHFRWNKGDTAIVVPDLTWHGEMQGVAERRTLDSRLEIGTLHLDLGSHDIDLNGFSHQAQVAFIGNLADPEIELNQRLAIRAVEQTLLPEYPLGDLSFALTAERNPDGVIHISDFQLANGLGGTTLAVTGNVDLAEGRRTLSVTTSLAQDLARLGEIPERLVGHGKLAVEANVTSPDFVHYRVRAAVKGEDVSLKLARAGYEVETANGEVPITVALEVSKKGVVLERSLNRNPYSMLRFADQLPLLRRSGFLSIVRLKTPFVVIAPLAGNLEIEQNVVSLRQFEMGVRGGSITGQCGLDWNGPKSTLELHVRANGVQSSHGEPFDGNIAVAISAADRTIDGRAEVLRIGERHLLDLLDLQDPQHVDAAMNRIRTALNFGYPDTMRLVFDHGFASAHLELGGLASLVSIGELRGIPMGPIVDRMIAQMMTGGDSEGTP